MKPYKLLILLFISTISISFFSLSFGTEFISPNHVLYLLIEPTSTQSITLLHFRLPRIIIAFFAGGLLASSGLLLQSALKNELASPDVIGLNKGAALLIVIASYFFHFPTKMILVLSSFIGSICATSLLFHVSRKLRMEPKTLILTGVAISFAFDAAIKLFTFSNKQLLMKQMTWLVGTLWGRSWEMVPLLMISTLLLFIFLYFSQHHFFILQLDSAITPSLGSTPFKLTWLYVIVSACLTAITVSIIGSMSFIGLIAPHITKRLIPTFSPYRFVCSFLIGSFILIGSDLIARSIIAPLEIPTGIIVSLIGGPYFLYLLRLKKQGDIL